MRRITDHINPAVEQIKLSAIDEVGTHPPPKAITSCDTTKVSDFPQSIFEGVYDSFCAEVNNTQSGLTWTVDSSGKKMSPKALRNAQTFIGVRTPPTNPEQYRDYRTTLQWQRRDAGEPCFSSCSDAYSFSAGNCEYRSKS